MVKGDVMEGGRFIQGGDFLYTEVKGDVLIPRGMIVAYVGLLFFLYGVVIWIAVQLLKLFSFLFTVIVGILIYAISFCFGKLLKGRVVPVFFRKG